MRPLIWLLMLLALPSPDLSAQQDYTFDLAKIKKKAFHFGGYFELLPILFGLDKDSRFYTLRFYDREGGMTTAESNFSALLDASYEKGKVFSMIRAHTDISKSSTGWNSRMDLYEAFVSIRPSLVFRFDIGKRRMKWGKGYAWNPAAFLDRPKNPNDPDLALEGYSVLSFDYIKSFPGKLKTISITPVVLPVYKHINSDFGKPNKLNWGGKLYLLLYDTDLDFMFLSGGSRPDRFGFDFSRNITSNSEIHGEFAYIPNNVKKFIAENGTIGEEKSAVLSYLVGLRYLSRTDTTFILEYLKNGSGFDAEEMGFFYTTVDHAYQDYSASGDPGRLNFLGGEAGQVYRSFAPMRDYLFLRITQKEPWNILYFIPALTGILNLDDKSLSLTPELFYTPINNLELRAKITFLLGGSGSEFREKQNKYRLEFRVRYYF